MYTPPAFVHPVPVLSTLYGSAAAVPPTHFAEVISYGICIPPPAIQAAPVVSAVYGAAAAVPPVHTAASTAAAAALPEGTTVL